MRAVLSHSKQTAGKQKQTAEVVTSPPHGGRTGAQVSESKDTELEGEEIYIYIYVERGNV